MAQPPRPLNMLAQLEATPIKKKLLEELRQQLAKDLGIPLSEIPQSNLPTWLGAWLFEHAAELNLAQLLYKIDLEPFEGNDFDQLAQRIVEREAQKVFFRAQYSGNL
jgi:hypothetical protein